MDVLTDILSTLRLRGTVYFQANFRSPWGMDIKGGAVANFHLVVKGRCWLRGPGKNQLQELNEGDIVVLAQGDRHTLVHEPNSDALPAGQLLGGEVLNRASDLEFGGDGEGTLMICGHYEFDRAGVHPLLAALPSLIHLQKDEQTDWITSASRLTVLESSSRESGSGAVVDRLAEVLLIQVIRAYAAREAQNLGFLAALTDSTVALALSVLHAEPEKPWRLDDLARVCGISKTVLVEKFNSTLGMAPIQYLTDWRMHRARALLTEGSNSSVAQVAEMVGYSSEPAFAKAYKRLFGEGPGATRKAHLTK